MSSDDALFIRLYIDEDVHRDVGSALRQQGYDVLTVGEARISQSNGIKPATA